MSHVASRRSPITTPVARMSVVAAPTVSSLLSASGWSEELTLCKRCSFSARCGSATICQPCLACFCQQPVTVIISDLSRCPQRTWQRTRLGSCGGRKALRGREEKNDSDSEEVRQGEETCVKEGNYDNASPEGFKLHGGVYGRYGSRVLATLHTTCERVSHCSLISPCIRFFSLILAFSFFLFSLCCVHVGIIFFPSLYLSVYPSFLTRHISRCLYACRSVSACVGSSSLRHLRRSNPCTTCTLSVVRLLTHHLYHVPQIYSLPHPAVASSCPLRPALRLLG